MYVHKPARPGRRTRVGNIGRLTAASLSDTIAATPDAHLVRTTATRPAVWAVFSPTPGTSPGWHSVRLWLSPPPDLFRLRLSNLVLSSSCLSVSLRLWTGACSGRPLPRTGGKSGFSPLCSGRRSNVLIVPASLAPNSGIASHPIHLGPRSPSIFILLPMCRK